MTNYDSLQCPECGLRWSDDPEDYPWLRNEEYIICSCGELLTKKSELLEEENILLQPA